MLEIWNSIILYFTNQSNYPMIILVTALPLVAIGLFCRKIIRSIKYKIFNK